MDDLSEARWRAVQNRDEESAGLFVYAVHTTGVFCRPGCPARRPLAKNVEFFATPTQAVACGYRACARCRPDHDGTSSPATTAVVAACRELERSGVQRSFAEIAASVGFSERHLRRLFVGTVGVSPAAYRRAQSSERVRRALRAGRPVTEAAVGSGFGSFRAFYEHGATRLGMTPARYRDGARGERIAFTSVTTSLGVVMAAATSRGVCSVQLGANDVDLAKGLAAEFPRAIIERDDDGLAEVARVLAGAANGDGVPAALPLDLEGTAFQARVWEALRTIPIGQTRTYSEVANQIGASRSVRAVASACAANPAALAVPCHRVVRRDGTLGGYRWGLERKTALLSAESREAAASVIIERAPSRASRR